MLPALFHFLLGSLKWLLIGFALLLVGIGVVVAFAQALFGTGTEVLGAIRELLPVVVDEIKAELAK